MVLYMMTKNTQEHGGNVANRKAGRPRAIPPDLVPKIIHLYDIGHGYRAIAHELRGEGLSVNWSTVRRLVKTIIAGRVEKKRA